jgi:glycosyltransferase involved in cell wall biosynthesis
MSHQPLITFHPSTTKQQGVFSILIPTWNNLPYLQCLIRSIQKNSTYQHEFVIHVNQGIDGTLEWVKQQGFSYTHSKTNVGVCFAFNAAAALANSELLLLTDDDKYYCPGWDKPLLDEVKQLNHIYFCVNATAIEHKQTTNPCVIAPYSYGDSIEHFDEQKLLDTYHSMPFQNWTGGNWYPMLLHRYVWQTIGGLSIEFTPGLGSDPDMMMKLWKSGVRYYKGVAESRVYHFISKSVSRVKKNNGYMQFLQKWGLASSTFFKYYLRLGSPFSGYTEEPDEQQMGTKKFKDKLKRAYSFIKH